MKRNIYQTIGTQYAANSGSLVIQSQSVSLRLSDEQPVERIAVVQREPKEFVKVPRVDGLDSEPEADESAGK